MNPHRRKDAGKPVGKGHGTSARHQVGTHGQYSVYPGTLCPRDYGLQIGIELRRVKVSVRVGKQADTPWWMVRPVRFAWMIPSVATNRSLWGYTDHHSVV